MVGLGYLVWAFIGSCFRPVFRVLGGLFGGLSGLLGFFGFVVWGAWEPGFGFFAVRVWRGFVRVCCLGVYWAPFGFELFEGDRLSPGSRH